MDRVTFIAIALLSIVTPCVHTGAAETFALTLSQSAFWKDNISYDAVYLPDGNSVVIEGWLWDCRTGRLLRRLNESSPGEERFALSPCGRTLALIDQGYRGAGLQTHWYGITLIEVGTGRKVRTFEIDDASLPGGKVSFRDDGTALFVVSGDRLFVLSVTDGKVENTFRGTCALSPDGRMLAEARRHDPSPDNAYYVDDRANPRFRIQLSSLSGDRGIERLLSVENGRVEHVAFTSDGAYVFAKIMRGVRNEQREHCIFWDIKTGKRKETESLLDGESYTTMSGTVFSEKYVTMVGGTNGGSAVLDLSSGKLIPVQVDGTGRSLIIGIAPNGEDCVVQRRAPSESPSLSLWFGKLRKRNSQQKDALEKE